MAKAVPALQPVELDCADESLALEMARWLTHLRAERRLSPKTLEAYARDLRQCLTFLSQHWGRKVTLKGFAALFRCCCFNAHDCASSVEESWISTWGSLSHLWPLG